MEGLLSTGPTPSSFSLTPLCCTISCRPRSVQSEPCRLFRSNLLRAHALFPTHCTLEFFTWTLRSCTLHPSTKSAWGTRVEDGAGMIQTEIDWLKHNLRRTDPAIPEGPGGGIGFRQMPVVTTARVGPGGVHSLGVRLGQIKSLDVISHQSSAGHPPSCSTRFPPWSKTRILQI